MWSRMFDVFCSRIYKSLYAVAIIPSARDGLYPQKFKLLISTFKLCEAHFNVNLIFF